MHARAAGEWGAVPMATMSASVHHARGESLARRIERRARQCNSARPSSSLPACGGGLRGGPRAPARGSPRGTRRGVPRAGPGHLLQPWVRQMPYDTLEAEPGWEVLEPARLAILDRRFAARVSPWPEIAAALVACVVDRARMPPFQHVASHIPGLEGRLLALMWAFADRWGRVTREGVVIPLRLTHATLAELVGASRPSVSTAVARLAREGVLTRTPGGWLLDRWAPNARGPSPSNKGEGNGLARGRLADASATLVAGAARV